MKKMIKMAFAAAMVMTMSANAMASDTKSTNNPMEATEVIASQQAGQKFETRSAVYEMGGYMNKFEYVIDQNGTVISKTQYRNNHQNNEWKPICSYNAIYEKECNRIEYATWNESEQSFSSDAKSTTYSKDECPVLLALPDIINY